jgi:hypothetical protein
VEVVHVITSFFFESDVIISLSGSAHFYLLAGGAHHVWNMNRGQFGSF